MLGASIFLIVLQVFKIPMHIFVIGNVLLALYFYISLKQYYNQGYFKTLGKLVLLIIAYNIIAFSLITIIGIISAALF
jgi:hypothetical protein